MLKPHLHMGTEDPKCLQVSADGVSMQSPKNWHFSSADSYLNTKGFSHKNVTAMPRQVVLLGYNPTIIAPVQLATS